MNTITFFDGRVTLQQLVVGIVVLVAIIAVLKFLKGVVRTVLTIVALCIGLVHYGIASPTQIKDAASVIADKGMKTYQAFADESENIKVSGKDIKIKAGGKWVSVSDISSYVKTGDGIAIIVDGKSIPVSDDAVKKLLETFK